MTWEKFTHPKVEFDFPLRDRLCFYLCKTWMNPETDELIFYQGLGNSIFTSTYAASSPLEDWAEAWAAYWMLKNGEDFEIEASLDYSFKASDTFNSHRFEPRKIFIQNLLESNPQYP